MTRKTVSGYEITITAFVFADPADPALMARAMKSIDGIVRSDFDAIYNDDEVEIAISPPRWIARRNLNRGPDESAPPSDDRAPPAGGKGQDDPPASPQDARAGQAGGEAALAQQHRLPEDSAKPSADSLDLPPGLDRRAPRMDGGER